MAAEASTVTLEGGLSLSYAEQGDASELVARRVAPETHDELVAELLKVPARVWREMFAGLMRNDDLTELPVHREVTEDRPSS